MANNDALGATVISRGWIRVKRVEGDRFVRTGNRTSFAELVKRRAKHICYLNLTYFTFILSVMDLIPVFLSSRTSVVVFSITIDLEYC